MPPLIDPERLAAYRDALANWSVRGYIHFELSEEAKRWARSALNAPFRDIGRMMHEHVLAGGEIDEVREMRPGWMEHWEFHWDLRLQIEGVRVYIETRLNYRVPVVGDESWILVVNIHEQ